MSLKWVMGYFVFLAAWRLVAAIDIMPASRALSISTPFIVMGLIVCALLALIAWVQARATVYTITNRRVAMRVGAALTVDVTNRMVAAELPNSLLQQVQEVLERSGLRGLGLQGQEQIHPWTFPAVGGLDESAHGLRDLVPPAVLYVEGEQTFRRLAIFGSARDQTFIQVLRPASSGRRSFRETRARPP